MLRTDRRRRQRQWPQALSLRYTRCGRPLSPVPPLAIAPLGASRNGRMACRGDLPAPDGHGLTADAVTVMVGKRCSPPHRRTTMTSGHRC